MCLVDNISDNIYKCLESVMSDKLNKLVTQTNLNNSKLASDIKDSKLEIIEYFKSFVISQTNLECSNGAGRLANTLNSPSK